MGIFGGGTFADTIEAVAKKAGLKVLKGSDNLVGIIFQFPDGRDQKVFLAPVGKLRGNTIVDIWSMVKEVTGSLDADLANRLLRENGRHKVGYWAIETIGDRSHLGAYHSLVLETLQAEELATVVVTLAKLADDLEQELTGGDTY